MELPSDANHTGRDLGAEEIELLTKVIRSGTLNCTKGTVVSEFEERFATMHGLQFARTTTSGTASIHSAISAIDPEPAASRPSSRTDRRDSPPDSGSWCG